MSYYWFDSNSVELRPREIQTELAEWEETSPQCWTRRMKEWH